MGKTTPDASLVARHGRLAHSGDPAEEGHGLADPLVGEGSLQFLLDVAQLGVEEIGSR